MKTFEEFLEGTDIAMYSSWTETRKSMYELYRLKIVETDNYEEINRGRPETQGIDKLILGIVLDDNENI